MKNLTSSELRKIYLDYYKSKGHAVISSASLIPETIRRYCSRRRACTPSYRTFSAKNTLRATV